MPRTAGTRDKKMSEMRFHPHGPHKDRHFNLHAESDDGNTHRILWRQRQGHRKRLGVRTGSGEVSSGSHKRIKT